MKSQPPSPPHGLEFIQLTEEKLCSSPTCGKLVSEGEYVIKRNERGRIYSDVIPKKHGICLSCAADLLSVMSVKRYEQILETNELYSKFKDKTEITQEEAIHMQILERRIEALDEFLDSLSHFVAYSEKNPTEYYDDKIKVEENADTITE